MPHYVLFKYQLVYDIPWTKIYSSVSLHTIHIFHLSCCLEWIVWYSPIGSKCITQRIRVLESYLSSWDSQSIHTYKCLCSWCFWSYTPSPFWKIWVWFWSSGSMPNSILPCTFSSVIYPSLIFVTPQWLHQNS